MLERITNSLGRLMVRTCAILAIAVVALAVRSFRHCDEAGYYSWKALPGTAGLECRRIIGSYRGGLFWLSTQNEVRGEVDWYGGPPTEIISDFKKEPVLVTESVRGMKAPFDPAGHWRRGGFSFNAESGKAGDGKTITWRRGVTVPDWLVFLLLAWLPMMSLRKRWIIRKRRRKGLCLYCGYDLRAASGICPECGKTTVEQRQPGARARRITSRWAAAAVLGLCVVIGLPWGIYTWGKRRAEKAVELKPGVLLVAGHLPQRIDLEIAPGVSMRFALIPAGHFLMGSPSDEKGRADDELQHEVFISMPFYMAVTPVTQEQYQAVMGNNPSYSKGPKRPVETVSWDEAVEFCRKVAGTTGRTIRLPTEAQWEYACRAGTTTPFNTGSTLPRGDAAESGMESSYPDNRHVPRGKGTVAVGSFRPNGWGLYDMQGSVWQWCSDWYDENYYAKSPQVDPAGPAKPRENARCVLRGGSWINSPHDCRSASRNCNWPQRRVNVGFRVALDSQ